MFSKKSYAQTCDEWTEYANSRDWDFADAMRTTARNMHPKSEVKVEFRLGTYYVMIKRYQSNIRSIGDK